jgi:hypothetical protein
LASLVAAALEASGANRNGGGPRLAGVDALRASLAGVAVREEEREAARWFAEATRPSVIVSPLPAAPTAVHRVVVAVADLAVLFGLLDRPGSALLVLPTRAMQAPSTWGDARCAGWRSAP